jgi:hypothetical protein
MKRMFGEYVSVRKYPSMVKEESVIEGIIAHPVCWFLLV